MKRLLLAFGLAAIGAAFLAASYTARPATSATGDCTLVLGGSITNNWFNDGNFQSKPGIVGGEWESITKGGAHLARIVTGEKLWPEWNANDISSDCTANSRLPQRVVLNALYRYDEDLVQPRATQLIHDVVAQIRERVNPNAQIILIPIVGATDACSTWAALSYDRNVAAIDQAVLDDPTLVNGPRAKIPCSQYADSSGHLNSAGASSAASQLAPYFTGPVTIPTPTPTATPTPIPVLVSCERVATYSNGSKVTTVLPLGDC